MSEDAGVVHKPPAAVDVEAVGEEFPLGPVHVRVDPHIEERHWVQNSVYVAADPVRIVPHQPKRRRLVLLNSGAATVFIGAHNNVDNVYGFPLVAGASEEFVHGSEVWAVTAAGITSRLAYSAELAVD